MLRGVPKVHGCGCGTASMPLRAARICCLRSGPCAVAWCPIEHRSDPPTPTQHGPTHETCESESHLAHTPRAAHSNNNNRQQQQQFQYTGRRPIVLASSVSVHRSRAVFSPSAWHAPRPATTTGTGRALGKQTRHDLKSDAPPRSCRQPIRMQRMPESVKLPHAHNKQVCIIVWVCGGSGGSCAKSCPFVSPSVVQPPPPAPLPPSPTIWVAASFRGGGAVQRGETPASSPPPQAGMTEAGVSARSPLSCSGS